MYEKIVSGVLILLVAIAFIGGVTVGYYINKPARVAPDNSQIERIVQATREYIVRERASIIAERAGNASERAIIERERKSNADERARLDREREIAIGDGNDLDRLDQLNEADIDALQNSQNGIGSNIDSSPP